MPNLGSYLIAQERGVLEGVRVERLFGRGRMMNGKTVLDGWICRW